EVEIMRAIAGVKGEAGWRLGESVQHQGAIEADLEAARLDRGPGAAHDLAGVRRQELDADLLQDAERGQVDLLDRLLVQDPDRVVAVDHPAPAELTRRG